MTPEEAESIGFPLDLLPTELTVEQACTQTCDDCGRIMVLHNDATWRFKKHIIRCRPCADRLLARGVPVFDAYFVA